MLEAWEGQIIYMCITTVITPRTHPLQLIPKFLTMLSLIFLISRIGSPTESKQINGKVEHVDSEHNCAEGYCNRRRDDWLLVSREDRYRPL